MRGTVGRSPLHGETRTRRERERERDRWNRGRTGGRRSSGCRPRTCGKAPDCVTAATPTTTPSEVVVGGTERALFNRGCNRRRRRLRRLRGSRQLHEPSIVSVAVHVCTSAHARAFAASLRLVHSHTIRYDTRFWYSGNLYSPVQHEW